MESAPKSVIWTRLTPSPGSPLREIDDHTIAYFDIYCDGLS